MSHFLHHNNNAKAIAIPQVFSQNSKAKKNKGMFGKGLTACPNMKEKSSAMTEILQSVKGLHWNDVDTDDKAITIQYLKIIFENS